MIENQYEERHRNGKSVFVTTAPIEILTTTRVPKAVLDETVLSHEWAGEKCALTLRSSGSLLTIEPGYEWDGVSFPLADLNRPDRMEATLHHDAIYEALRELIIPRDSDGRLPEHPTTSPWRDFIRARKWSDRCFREILRRDRAPQSGLFYDFVREFSGGAAWPEGWPPRMKLLRQLHGIP